MWRGLVDKTNPALAAETHCAKTSASIDPALLFLTRPGFFVRRSPTSLHGTRQHHLSTLSLYWCFVPVYFAIKRVLIYLYKGVV